MLLQPFEEQFYLPPVVIQLRHFQGTDIQSISEEDKFPVGFGVEVHDSPYLLWILAHGQLSVHISDSIREYAGWQPALPPHRPEVVVLPASDHEVCPDSEPPEVIVGAAEDVERVLLVWDCIHRFCIVPSGWRDMEECGHLCIDVIQRMYLDSSFLLPEQGPAKDAEAQVNRGGVKSVYLASELEYLDRPALPGFCHNTIGELLEDARQSQLLFAFDRLLLVVALPKPKRNALPACACVARTKSLRLSRLTVARTSLRMLVPAGKGLDIPVTAVFL